MKKKFITMILALAMILSMTACTGSESTTTTQSDAATESSEGNTENTSESNEDVTIRFFSNLTDRTSGQGLIEQMLIDMYLADNPNVTIEIEALDDDPYKTKFKAYASGSNMPDVVNAWGHPSFISEVIDAGLLAELEDDYYADYNFIPGSLAGFSKNDKLYGLARNTDVMGFYYNKAIFADNGWDVPESYDDLLDLAADANSAGIIPVAMAGSDKWPVAIYLHDITTKLGGDVKDNWKASLAECDFSEEIYAKSAQVLKQSVDAKLFQTGFETSDYGTALNLFVNGQAAMFYMGSWEMSMATNPEIDENVRNNIGVFMMPEIDGGKGTVKDITAWNGGGYAISANSPVKDEAVKLLNFMFKPENWARLTWENGICMSAQDYSPYLTGNETPIQKAFTDILTGCDSISGVTFNDLSTSEFKTLSETIVQEIAIGSISVEEFSTRLEESCK